MALLQTLHFTGRFTDLIPNGWTFHKLFARNYRCYFYPTIGAHGDHVVIWQRNRYVVFPQLHEESSAALMHYVLGGVEFKEYSEVAQKKLGLTGLAPIGLIYDETLNEFRPLILEQDDMVFALSTKSRTPTDAEMDQWKKDHAHLKKYWLSSEFTKLILKWYNDKFFEFSA